MAFNNFTITSVTSLVDVTENVNQVNVSSTSTVIQLTTSGVLIDGGPGPRGDTGYTGSLGYTGSRGYTGSAGPQGIQGIQGIQGFTGSIGYTGSKGLDGYVGADGPRGYTGSQGPAGAGYTGSQGIQGIQGLQGYTGSQGPAGAGYTGSQGIVGYTGSRGYQGYTGSNGGANPWVVVDSPANNSAGINSQYLVDTSNWVNATLVLPSNPAWGSYVYISDGGDWSQNNLTVLRNGNLIEGRAEDFLLDVKGVEVFFIYSGPTAGWRVTSTLGAVGPTGYTGSRGATGPTRSRSIVIKNPTASENVTAFYTETTMSINAIYAVVRGTSPSVRFSVRFSSNRSAAGDEVITGGTLVSSTVSMFINGFNIWVIPANSWVWITTTASTNATELALTINCD